MACTSTTAAETIASNAELLQNLQREFRDAAFRIRTTGDRTLKSCNRILMETVVEACSREDRHAFRAAGILFNLQDVDHGVMEVTSNILATCPEESSKLAIRQFIFTTAVGFAMRDAVPSGSLVPI